MMIILIFRLIFDLIRNTYTYSYSSSE